MTDTAWIAGDVKIPLSALREIERAGIAAYARDEEACGYITGPASDPLLADTAVELEVRVHNTLAGYLDVASPTPGVFAGQTRAGLFGPVTIQSTRAAR